jgi:hypothetical protein
MSALGALGGALGLGIGLCWLLAGAAAPALGPIRKAGPGPRADLALCVNGMVLLVGITVVVGALIAPGLGALGLGVDHCDVHDGHAHLCLRHGPAGPGWIGGFGLALLAARLPAAMAALRDQLRLERLGRGLAALGVESGGLRVVPTDAPLCHTVGLLRPTTLISGTLLAGLAPAAATAVRAHEAAHRRAHDTRVAAALELAAALFPPLAPWRRLWAAAAEELADEAAARATDRLTVAAALVQVAAAGRPPALGLGAASGGVEARVLRLLGPAPAARPRWGPVALAGLALTLLAALGGAHHELHHAAETIFSLGAPGGW